MEANSSTGPGAGRAAAVRRALGWTAVYGPIWAVLTWVVTTLSAGTYAVDPAAWLYPLAGAVWVVQLGAEAGLAAIQGAAYGPLGPWSWALRDDLGRGLGRRLAGVASTGRGCGCLLAAGVAAIPVALLAVLAAVTLLAPLWGAILAAVAAGHVAGAAVRLWRFRRRGRASPAGDETRQDATPGGDQ